MSYQSIKDPRRLASYMKRRNLRKRQLRAHLKSINQGALSVAQRWTQFDPAYQTAVLSYKEHGAFSLPPCSLKDARTIRTKLYTYRRAIYEGVKSDTDYDPILLDLIDAFSNVIIRIEPAADGRYILSLCQDPLTAAMATAAPSKLEEAAADD
jgi:hypothetical protein